MDVFEQLAIVRARHRMLQAAWTGGTTMAAADDQAIALVDAAAALARGGIRHMLIGGLAVAVHSGVARATLDVDFAIPSGAARKQVIECLVATSFRHVGTHAHSLNFAHRSGEPVQLAFDPGFDAAIERAAVCQVRGQAVAIVTRDDLIAMKIRAAADPARRPSKALQDRVDIAYLQGDVPEVHEGW